MELLILIVAVWLGALVTSIVLGHMLAAHAPHRARRPHR